MFKNFPNYLIFSLFSASAVSANTLCVHPIIKEKIEFYMHPLPSETCITYNEKNIQERYTTPFKSVDDICREKGLLLKSELEEILLAKKEPTIECNIINGLLDKCSTPWGGKVLVEKARDYGTSQFSQHNYFELLGFRDKKDNLIILTPTKINFWHNPTPTGNYPSGYEKYGYPGTWTGLCNLFQSKLGVNKFFKANSDFKFKKNRYVVNDNYKWFGAYVKVYWMLGENEYEETEKGDF